MNQIPSTALTESAAERCHARIVAVRYVILTIAIFAPLFWSFWRLNDYYPVAVPTLFWGASHLHGDRTYYVLRGETESGEVLDIPAITFTSALYARNWSVVRSVARNELFLPKSLHPDNVLLVDDCGGLDRVPEGARMKDLLDAWGRIYNERLPAASDQRLEAMWIDAFEWPRGEYGNYSVFLKSWRTEL